jgi:hypothetical protein
MNGGGGGGHLMKRDAHTKRLELWINYLKTGRSGILPALPYPEILAELDFKIAGVVDERANLALRPATITEPIREAFDRFDLDPANPFAWRLLLHVFADTHFGPRITAAGAPKKWTDVTWCELLSDFDQVKARNPNASDTAICKFLKNDPAFGNRYAKVSAATIRRNLQPARSPGYNETLKMVADAYVEIDERVGGDHTPQKKEAMKQASLEKALGEISSVWKRRAKIET